MMFFRKKAKKQFEQDTKTKTQEPFNTYGISDILHIIKREIGVDLFGKKNILETRLRLFSEDREIRSFVQLKEEIQKDAKLKQELVDLVTVNETYFCREKRQLVEAVTFAGECSGNVEILCAPCATGEEVYTLAMMLNETYHERLSYSITGIDINSEAIRRANQGIYMERALHKLADEKKSKYFSQDSDKYTIRKHLFKRVRFLQQNIFDSSFLHMGKYDILFSRNMFIYFDEEFRLEAAKRFAALLKPQGRMYLGHADIVPDNQWLTKHGFGSHSYYSLSEH